MKLRRTFRGRLLLANTLPILLLIPLAGLGTIYFLQIRVILPALTDGIISQARLADVEQALGTARWMVLGILLVSLAAAGIVSMFFARSVDRQIRAMVSVIANSAVEGQGQYLPESGDREFSDLARAYNRLLDRRQAVEKNRQQILANLVHEIGRPLGSLHTALHALQTGAINDQPLRTDLLKGMVERIDRLERLLEDLSLVYQGLEPEEAHLQSVQINEWLESLTPVWAETARQKQITWEVAAPDDIPIVHTDPDRLAQALSNLVNNAIKFTPTGGRITLRVFVGQSALQLSVSDTGTGIPVEDQSSLFVPFYRGAQSTQETPGFGLGLSIAKSIIESLGGNITLVSAPGKGSTFTINLPLH